MLIGHRIKLRAVELDDVEKLAKWRSNPDVYEYFYEYEPLSTIQQKKWLEKELENKENKFFIVSTLDGEAVGTVGFVDIDWRNRKAEWGRILIAEQKYRKDGYGSEVLILILEYAFEHLNLNKLYCEALVSNQKAIALYKKFGFKEDGRLRSHIYKQGKYVDVSLLSILREEYFEKKEELYRILHQKASADSGS